MLASPSFSGRAAVPPRTAWTRSSAAACTSAAGSTLARCPSTVACGACPSGSAQPAAKVAQPAQYVVPQLPNVIVGAWCRVVQLVVGDGADGGGEVGAITASSRSAVVLASVVMATTLRAGERDGLRICVSLQSAWISLARPQPKPVEQDSRGILDPWLLRQRMRLTRYPVGTALSGLIDRFWAVEWDPRSHLAQPAGADPSRGEPHRRPRRCPYGRSHTRAHRGSPERGGPRAEPASWSDEGGLSRQ